VGSFSNDVHYFKRYIVSESGITSLSYSKAVLIDCSHTNSSRLSGV